MTHQQIIKLAAQAESEGNYRYADFLDRELVRVGLSAWWQKGVGKATEMGLAKGLEKGVAGKAGGALTDNLIDRAFAEGSEGTQAALRGLEVAQPKSGTMFQEAAGKVFGQGNKVITRTIEEVMQAEAKINQIIQKIAELQTSSQIKNANIIKQIQGFEETIRKLPTSDPQRVLFQKRIDALRSSLNESSNSASTIAQKHLSGQKLNQEEMQLLYKEILRTEPTAFTGKSKIRPSDAYDMLVNKKITNANMNRILGGVEKFKYAPEIKGSKWGTGLMAGAVGYGLLNYGLPLAGAGIAAAQVAGNAAKKKFNNAFNPNQAASAAGNVQGGSSTYSLSRDDASVGNSQYLANRAPSATVANNKTKWIKTSDL